MRKWMLCGVMACALVGGGCGLFGVHTNPSTGETTSDGKGGIIGTVASYAGLPWVATAITALAGIYVDAKRRGWKGAALSTFDAIEAWKETPEGKAVWEGLKAKLGIAHAEAEVKKLVDKALGNT